MLVFLVALTGGQKSSCISTTRRAGRKLRSSAMVAASDASIPCKVVLDVPSNIALSFESRYQKASIFEFAEVAAGFSL